MEMRHDSDFQHTEVEIDQCSTSSKRARAPKGTSSIAWTVFERIGVDSNGVQKAKCKQCKVIFTAEKNYGTKNLLRHLDVCPNGEGNSGNIPLRRLDQEIFREKLCTAIIKHNYPFSYAEHEGNRDLHSYLHPEVQHLSRNTVKTCVLKKFANTKENLKNTLEGVKGRICLTSDLWSSITTDGYLALTAHYVDEDWVLQKKILNFRHVPPPHSGPILAERVILLLKDWGIEKKIFSLTLDNASYNDGLVGVLKSHMRLTGSLVCDGEFFHVRCGAHVLNLIVQAGLKVIEGCIYKVRESVKYVKGSEARKIKFARCIVQQSLECKKLVRQDVVTRWNSTYLMLDSALAYRLAYYELKLVDTQYKHCPSDEEWNKIERIARFLQPFYDITTLFSGSHYVTANLYFHGVWKIHSLILEEMNNEDKDFSEMAKAMKSKFEKYWDCYSVVLSMAVVLDPRYKMQYVEYSFKKIYPITYLEKARNLREKLDLIFRDYMCLSPTNCASSFDGDNGDVAGEMDEFDWFESENYGLNRNKSQLELLYLEEKRLDHKQPIDILSYWKANRIRYPNLSLMARDILSIPITSVASESAFSIGGRILGKYRTSLLPKNVEALICTRDWLYKMSDSDDEEEDMCVDFAPIIDHIDSLTIVDD